MSTLLLTALGLALVMTTMTETMITANYRDGGEAMYAADAGVERVMQDLLTVPDWNRILSGARAVAVHRRSAERHDERCRRRRHDQSDGDDQPAELQQDHDVHASSEMNAYTNERPWTTNNPRWQLFAYAPLDTIIDTGTITSSFYVVVWIADDQSEIDDDPATDGALTSTGGGHAAHARGGIRPGRQRTASSKSRSDAPTRPSWSAATPASADRTNRTAAPARPRCETPGKALTRSDMGATVGGFVTH